MAGSEALALLPPAPWSSGYCQNRGCLSATLLMALGEQGEKGELFFLFFFSPALTPAVIYAHWLSLVFASSSFFPSP